MVTSYLKPLLKRGKGMKKLNIMKYNYAKRTQIKQITADFL